MQTSPFRYDFQSKDGFGFLLPSDAFHMSSQIIGPAVSGPTLVNWRLFYRFVQIPIEEFVGLVQSFQTG